ncbi:MAG TPA: hypothetical protein VGS58_11070, partial [Candidatus Sulfopaludibacter sp.]|nr:hypothetical protein [Candidatus Sulfopaludibacter sp.]
MSADRLLGAMGAILIGTYFFRLVRPSLHVYFSPDDLMNLQVSWTQSLASLVRANLLFFESSIFGRPLGSVWYRAIYHLAGLNPVPFHAANLVILALNIALAFALARRLSGSPETGAIAALLFCYRPQMAYLYFNTGFIYDVLCCFFYLAALLLYVEVRRRGMLPGLGGLAGLCVLYILALNSKEMAVTFPVILTTYELLYHRPSLSSFRHWPMREGRAIVVTGIMTLAFVIGRIAGAQSLTKFEA